MPENGLFLCVREERVEESEVAWAQRALIGGGRLSPSSDWPSGARARRSLAQRRRFVLRAKFVALFRTAAEAGGACGPSVLLLPLGVGSMCSVVPGYSPGFKKPPATLRLKRKRPRRSDSVLVSGGEAAAAAPAPCAGPPDSSRGPSLGRALRRNPFSSVENTPRRPGLGPCASPAQKGAAAAKSLAIGNDTGPDRSSEEVNSSSPAGLKSAKLCWFSHPRFAPGVEWVRPGAKWLADLSQATLASNACLYDIVSIKWPSYLWYVFRISNCIDLGK